MIVSRKLSEAENVNDVSVMMGTDANKALLRATGFWHDDFSTAAASDICVAIRTEQDDPAIVQTVAAQLDAVLTAQSQGSAGTSRLPIARRWDSACEKLPQASLVLISIAGEYAAALAHQALDQGKNVMIFSDNVTLDEEVALKRRAREKGLLVMGPDCGTAILAGTPLAFANVVPQGNIGVIGASGTGIQEFISQVALAQGGISHAIGTGGRDLTAQVGAISALSALEMLSHDARSQVLALISKPPAAQVRQQVIQALKACGKPVVVLFLGYRPPQPRDENLWFATTLDEAARLACLLARVASRCHSIAPPGGGRICGLYSGGTLAAEAAALLAARLGLDSAADHPQGMMLNAAGHQIIDLGDDFYTVGRPHPMIDPALRQQRIIALAAETAVRVLLADVVLGFGACDNPAEALVQAYRRACDGRPPQSPLYAVVTVTGSENDPQCRSLQIAILEDAGIVVAASLPEAVLLAAALIATPDQLSPRPESGCGGLLDGVAVINAGLRRFALDLQKNAVPLVHYQWAPVAGGNQKLIDLLARLH